MHKQDPNPHRYDPNKNDRLWVGGFLLVLAIVPSVLTLIMLNDPDRVGIFKQEKVLIIPGYGATAQDHWFPWLAAELRSAGIDTEVVEMPNPQNPNFEDWLSTLEKQMDQNNRTTIVAHSLGTIATLQFLQRSGQYELEALFLVAPFDQSLARFPELEPFTTRPIDYDAVERQIEHVEVFASYDDRYVPYSFSRQVADKLDANLHSYDEANHFLAEDGYERFPQLLQEVKKCLRTYDSIRPVIW